MGEPDVRTKAIRSARRQIASCILRAMSIRNAELQDIADRLEDYSVSKLGTWLSSLTMGEHTDGADELRLFSDVLIALDFEPQITLVSKETN